MAASTTVTIKSRPLADGSVSWSLWLRRPRPLEDELIKLDQFSRAEDRPAIEAVADTYRTALKVSTGAVRRSAPASVSCRSAVDRRPRGDGLLAPR